MITPIYFPQTFLSPDNQEKILSCFGSLALYSALGCAENQDPRVKTLVPVVDDEQRLMAYLKEYRQFAAMHKDKASAFLQGHGGLPFHDADGTLGIKSDVLKGRDGDQPSHTDQPDDSDRLFMARAFLEIARDYDEKKWEIDREMERINRKEKDLLEQLQGCDESGNRVFLRAEEPTETDPSGDINTENRLSVWARLFIHAWPDPALTGQGLFVTTSPKVVERLVECVPGLEKAGGCDYTAVDALSLQSWIREATVRESSGDSGRINPFVDGSSKQSLSLYTASGISPYTFFSYVSGAGKRTECGSKDIKNTVIALFHL